MAAPFPVSRYSVPPSVNKTATDSKKLALIAASIGTIAGALWFGRSYAIATFGLWSAAYLIHSCKSQTNEPAKMKSPRVWKAISRPIPLCSLEESTQSSQKGSWIAQKMQEYSRTGLIYFYDRTNPATEWMGNYYETPVQFNQATFRNSEAAFQAQKFIYHPQLMQQFTTLSGDQAFHLARNNFALIRPDWANVKVQTMADILCSKVVQHPEIAKWLRATGNAHLVEHNPVKGRDAFWSDDNDGTGKNMLGKLWMQVRSSLFNGPIIVPEVV